MQRLVQIYCQGGVGWGGSFVTKKPVPVQIFSQGEPGLLSQRNPGQCRFVVGECGWGSRGRTGGAGVGWKGLSCFIMLFVNLYCAGKERKQETILILKNNPKLNSNGAVNM